MLDQMISEFIYVPILQTKQNEYLALKELDQRTKSKLKPLFKLTNAKYDSRAQNLPKHLLNSWGNLPCYIDLNIDQDFIIHGQHYAEWIIENLNNNELTEVTLVLSIGSSKLIKDAVKMAVKKHGYKLAIRVYIAEISSNINALILDIANDCSLDISDIDLILDYAENMQATSYLQFSSLVTTLKVLTTGVNYKNVVITGCAMPKELKRDDFNPYGLIERTEWLAYTELMKSEFYDKKYIFGDYASVYSEEFDSDLPVKPNVKLKYTLEDNYMILVRYQAVVHADGFGQYKDVCQYIANSPHFYGSTFSYGDEYIANCAKGLVSTGNFGTWVKVGVNHHITVAVNQLANPHATSEQDEHDI